MEKFKICPVCHAKNSPAVLECVECGNDLMGVRIVDETFIEEQKKTEPETGLAQTSDIVRVCDCGAENELSARKCSVCGEDISDVIPTPRKKATGSPNFLFISFDDAVKLELICPSEHIIGRENELAEYLSTKSFVSRRHAKLTVTAEGVFVENLSKANGTYINNEKIDDGKAYKLCVHDEVGLGGFVNQNGRQELAAYFVIRDE